MKLSAAPPISSSSLASPLPRLRSSLPLWFPRSSWAFTRESRRASIPTILAISPAWCFSIDANPGGRFVPNFDVSVVGELNLDLIFYGLPETLELDREHL